MRHWVDGGRIPGGGVRARRASRAQRIEQNASDLPGWTSRLTRPRRRSDRNSGQSRRQSLVAGLTIPRIDIFVQNLFYDGGLVIAGAPSRSVRKRQPKNFS